jgi:thiol-disulfide isomerase/thioredoxin
MTLRRQSDFETGTAGGNPEMGRLRSRSHSWERFIISSMMTFLIFGCAAHSRMTEPRVEAINEKKLNAVLQKNRDRVVLLNFWATWCEPCVAEFPELVRLANENLGRVAVIAVSIDDDEEVHTKVIPFLQKQAVPFTSYIKKTKDDEAFINHVDPKWSGAIPATFIYRPDGTLAQRMIGQQSYEKFFQALQLAAASQQEDTTK